MSTPDGAKANFPILQLAEGAAGIGHVSIEQDLDGTLRHELPVYRYGDYLLSLIRRPVGPGLRRRPVQRGRLHPRQVDLGRQVHHPARRANQMLITYNGPEQTFRTFSYQDVMNDKVSMDAFKDKIVIIGPTALGRGDGLRHAADRQFPAHRDHRHRRREHPALEVHGPSGLVGEGGMGSARRSRPFHHVRAAAPARSPGLVVSLVLMTGLMGGPAPTSSSRANGSRSPIPPSYSAWAIWSSRPSGSS